MSSIQERLQLKRVPLDTWNIREQLCLASAVVRSGDQNWMSVSRALKTVGEPNRPPDWYSQKSCAAQYGTLLENVETPKRKKRSSEGAVETPQESIVKRLTQERMVEIQKTVAEINQQYEQLLSEVSEVRNASTSEERLRELWAGVEASVRAREREAARRAAWLKEREERRARAERNWRPSDSAQPASTTPSSPLLTSLLKSSPVMAPQHVTIPAPVVVTEPTEQRAVVTTPQHIPHPASVVETVSPSAGAPTLSLLLEKHDNKRAAIEHIKSQLVQIEKDLTASSSSPSPAPPPLTPAGGPPALDIDDIEIKAEDVYAFRDIDLHIPPVASIHKTNRSQEKIFKKDELSSAPEPMDIVQEEEIKVSPVVEEKTVDVETIDDPPEVQNVPDVKPVIEVELKQETEPEVKIAFPEVKFPTPEIKVIQPEDQKSKEEIKETEPMCVDDPPPSEEVLEESTAEVAEVRESTPPPLEEPVTHTLEETAEETVETVVEPAPEPEITIAPEVQEIHPPEPQTTEPDVEEPQVKEEVADAPQEETQEQEVVQPEVQQAEVEEPVVTALPEPEADSQDSQKAAEQDVKKQEEEEEDIPLKEMVKEEAPEVSEAEVPSDKPEVEDTHTETDDDTPMELSREEEKDGKKRRDYSRKKKPDSRTCSGSESAPDSPHSSDAERQHRLWKKSVMLVYSRLCTHKYASLFTRPISDDEAPGYSVVVKRPMDLTTIKRNIENGVIRTTAEFQRDVLLMLINAVMYNNSKHSVNLMAKEMFVEAESQLGMLLAAQAHAGLSPAPRRKRRHV